MTMWSSIQPISFFGVLTLVKRRPCSNYLERLAIGHLAYAIGDFGHAVAQKGFARRNVDLLGSVRDESDRIRPSAARERVSRKSVLNAQTSHREKTAKCRRR